MPVCRQSHTFPRCAPLCRQSSFNSLAGHLAQSSRITCSICVIHLTQACVNDRALCLSVFLRRVPCWRCTVHRGDTRHQSKLAEIGRVQAGLLKAAQLCGSSASSAAAAAASGTAQLLASSATWHSADVWLPVSSGSKQQARSSRCWQQKTQGAGHLIEALQRSRPRMSTKST